MSRLLLAAAVVTGGAFAAAKAADVARDLYWGWHNEVWGRGWSAAWESAEEWRAAGLDPGPYPIERDVAR